MSGNEARLAGWRRPAGPVVSIVRKWPRHGQLAVNLADDGAWCLAGAIPGARLIVEPWLLLWTGGCGTGGTDIDWLSALVGWHCGVATQRAGVDHQALYVHQATAASECTFHWNYICLSMPTQNGLAGWGCQIKDVNERRTSLEIGMCGVQPRPCWF